MPSPEMIDVLVIAINWRGTLRHPEVVALTIQNPNDGTEGVLYSTAAEVRGLLGDCPTSDLITVDRVRIAWRPVDE